ncbi:type II toxin-antitoxin system Xre/ParS family antitoxin [Marinobacter sp.]|uniref:type II RES/Xre toxin-antitoxin system antitoxin n=1 Tax=Marinobacter sp. TaxID=50741 RepID=UPI003B51BC73
MNRNKGASLTKGQGKSPTLVKSSQKGWTALGNDEIFSSNVDLAFRELLRSAHVKLKAASTVEVMEAGRVPASVVLTLTEWLNTHQKDMLELLKISQSTFNRRRRSGGLRCDEADRVYRYMRLYILAANLFHGDAKSAREWLKEPAYAFKGKTPLQHAGTELGAREVETLIGRIEHGIPS